MSFMDLAYVLCFEYFRKYLTILCVALKINNNLDII